MKPIFLNMSNGMKKKGDAVIFDEDKNYRAIKEFPNIKLMVEDNAKFAQNIASLGYKVFLIEKSYNRGITHGKIDYVKTLEEVKW